MQRITAMGGGGFLMEGTPLLDDFILSRARGSASRVCFVATASGDHDRMLVNFYAALGPHYRATHLPLFRRQHADVVAHLLAQDVIDVGGGTPLNMLAVGRVHGVDLALRRAYEAGILMCGVSAGALSPWRASDVTTASAQRGRTTGSACHDGVEADCGDDTGLLAISGEVESTGTSTREVENPPLRNDAVFLPLL